MFSKSSIFLVSREIRHFGDKDAAAAAQKPRPASAALSSPLNTKQGTRRAQHSFATVIDCMIILSEQAQRATEPAHQKERSRLAAGPRQACAQVKAGASTAKQAARLEL